MKKVVRSIAVVALMFATATGLAKEPKLSLTSNTGKTLNFEMDITTERTFVSIVDVDGETIYTEKIATGNGYAKKFDLQNLPDGIYYLEVENSQKEIIFGFNVADSDISIVERKENVKPVFIKKEGLVFLNLLNLEEEAVKIKVLNSDGRLVFNEISTEKALIEKVFNFKSAFEDSYTIIVKNSTDTYTKDVIVR